MAKCQNVSTYGPEPEITATMLPLTDERDALRDYCLAHARWVVVDGKVGTEPVMPPPQVLRLRHDAPESNLER